MTGLSALEVVALVVAAAGVGFAKTAIGGFASISVAIFAAVLPPRASTGALLPLLLVGDVAAVSIYRQHVDWPRLLRLFPSVGAGVLVGVVFVARVGDTVMRRTIGTLLLALVAVHLWQRRRQDRSSDASGPGEKRPVRRHGVAAGFGVLAGFTTMVADSGGPVMSIYLLSAGMGMLGFLATGAWFFFVVNLFKVPFSAGLDLLTVDSLLLDAWLAPAVLVGTAVGRAVISRIDQSRFETLVLVSVVASSLDLVR